MQPNSYLPSSDNPTHSTGGFSLWAFLRDCMVRARFMTISILAHLILVALAGTVVLFRAVDPPLTFQSEGPPGSGAEASAEPPAPPEPTVPQMDTAVTPVAVMPDTASLDAIVTSSLNSNATLNAVSQKSTSTANLGLASTTGRGSGKTGSVLPSISVGRGGAFGSKEKSEDTFVGTFYDLKQLRTGKPSTVDNWNYCDVYRKFVEGNWREGILNDYFQGPKQLYTAQFMIPKIDADEGPKAFGLEKEVEPSRWLAHYKARVAAPFSGKIHFVGAGDDVLIVRFDRKVVLDRCWFQQERAAVKPERNYLGWSIIANGRAKGPAVTVVEGEFYEMEVLIGEQPGGLVFFNLQVEQEGVEYKKDSHGNPILPVFRVKNVKVPETKDPDAYPPFEQNGPIWTAKEFKNSGSGFGDIFKKN